MYAHVLSILYHLNYINLYRVYSPASLVPDQANKTVITAGNKSHERA